MVGLRDSSGDNAHFEDPSSDPRTQIKCWVLVVAQNAEMGSQEYSS